MPKNRDAKISVVRALESLNFVQLTLKFAAPQLEI